MSKMAHFHADELGGGVVLEQRLVMLILQQVLVRPRLKHMPLCGPSAASEEVTSCGSCSQQQRCDPSPERRVRQHCPE